MAEMPEPVRRLCEALDGADVRLVRVAHEREANDTPGGGREEGADG